MSAAPPYRSKRFAFGLALLVLGVCGFGAARAETLEDALTEAYQTNPTLLSERAHLRAVDEGVPQALANWRPTIAFAGGAGAERTTNSPYAPVTPVYVPFKTNNCPPNAPACIFNIPSTFQALNNTTPNTIDVNINQPLYRGGRTVAQTSVAEKTVESERARLLVTEQQTFYAVIQAYLDVYRDQSTLDLSIANEHVLQKQLESTSEQFRVGTLTRTDVAQAQAQYAGAVADRIQAEGNLQVSRATYERVVGHLPPKLRQTKARPILPRTLDEALGLAANKNPNVIAALFAEDAARDQVNVVRGQLLPTLSIVGDYQRNNDTAIQHYDQTVASVEARMTMPLYEGGAIYSQTRQAEQTVGQMKGQTDDARRAAVQGATQAWETMSADRERAKALEENVKAAAIAVQGTQEEQRVGTRTILDVLIVQQQLFTAQVTLVSTQHDVALAEFNLALQIGRLSLADLKLNVKAYDVRTHYHSVRDKWFGFGSSQ